jgi:hypothetical protein
MLIKFADGMDNIKKDSAVDVLRDSGGIPSKTFKNKLVLVGITDAGIGSSFVTPGGFGLPIQWDRSVVPAKYLGRKLPVPTSLGAPAGVRVVGADRIVCDLLLSSNESQAGVGGDVGPWGGSHVGRRLVFVFGQELVDQTLLSSGRFILRYVVVTVRRFFFTEMRKELVEAQSIETNKSLGLSYQTQGLLDMAFEKLRKCPVDSDMKGILYNLALDFERKRQFGKAGVVYDHVAQVDADFKDIKERAKAVKQASETGGLSGGLGGKQGGTVVFSAGAAKPTLGRYEIEKELGRGAMGVVYFGRDPKINRSVAIKTLRFEDDSEPESAKSIRERFFREAESAGTLNHPNIIRIFDAGEDNDIAFIAMELLEGEDLKKYVEKANLLPFPWWWNTWPPSPMPSITPTPMGWSIGTSNPPTSCD